MHPSLRPHLRPLLRPLVHSFVPLALGCLLLCSPAAFSQSAPQQPERPAQPQPAQAVSPLADPAAYVAQQFGTSFKVDPKVPPLFGDLDGDGNEDLVLVGTSPTPLLSQEEFGFKVEDPYNAYYGTGDVHITSQFNLHFDGSARDLLIVFGWRLPPPAGKAGKSKRVSKFVLINTPMETVSLASLRLKKKHIQAIEAVDRTTLHSLILWNGKRWVWSAQGMAGDEALDSLSK